MDLLPRYENFDVFWLMLEVELNTSRLSRLLIQIIILHIVDSFENN